MKKFLVFGTLTLLFAMGACNRNNSGTGDAGTQEEQAYPSEGRGTDQPESGTTNP